MTFRISTYLYLSWFSIWVFLELSSYFFGPLGIVKPGIVPWTTLSEWVWADEQIFPPLMYIMLLGLPLLAGHFAHFTFAKLANLFR